MWNLFRLSRRRNTSVATRRHVEPLLEPLEDRFLLSGAHRPKLPTRPPEAAPPESPPPPSKSSHNDETGSSQPSKSSQLPKQEESIALTEEANRPRLPEPPPKPSPSFEPVALAIDSEGRPGGGPGGGGLGPPGSSVDYMPPPPQDAASTDPAALFRIVVIHSNTAAQQVPSASHNSLVMRAFSSDLDDSLPLVEIAGDLSFFEEDSRSIAQEFTALLTNTRPRPDVVPQQGSAVASVATLMPSDRVETANPVVVSEFSPLLIESIDRSAKTPPLRDAADSPLLPIPPIDKTSRIESADNP